MRSTAVVRNLLFIACIACNVSTGFAQTDTTAAGANAITDISSKTITVLQKKYASVQERLNKQSAKLLSRMQAKEDKLQRQLQTSDSTKAQTVFTDEIKRRYASLKAAVLDTTSITTKFPLREYVPGLDSMQTSLSFLLQSKYLPADKLQQLQALSTQVKSLETELQKANDIQSFVREREANLKEQLLNTGVAKKLTGINKQVFYYQTELSQYKELLNDKEKLKEKILETAVRIPAFQKFWQRNSYLSALFPRPYDNTGTQVYTGLQTRASVQNLLAQRIGNVSVPTANTLANPTQYVQPGIDQAQAQFSNLKNKLNNLANGGGNSDMTMPDFKPNDQKTKTFFQRLEYGFNIQSQPGTNFLPANSDIAVTLGYKLSDSKTFGVGASYKVGWGTGWNNIKLTSQGAGVRSYAEMKAKGSVWVTGGFEYNYLSSFRSLEDLHNNIDAWQRSALLGLSKKYKIGSRKEGNIQVLYDFLHNQENPPSQALKFRLGYTF